MSEVENDRDLKKKMILGRNLKKNSNSHIYELLACHNMLIIQTHSYSK